MFDLCVVIDNQEVKMLLVYIFGMKNYECSQIFNFSVIVENQIYVLNQYISM
jgi:hypothetical protein